jgi:hypothetical protein
MPENICSFQHLLMLSIRTHSSLSGSQPLQVSGVACLPWRELSVLRQMRELASAIAPIREQVAARRA